MTCFPHWTRIYVLSHDCDKCYSHFRGSQLTAHYNYLGPLTVDQFLGPIRQTHAWTECHQVLKAPQHGDRCYIVAKSCPPLCNPMDCGTPCFPVLHYFTDLLKFMSTESVMPSNHLILCRPLLLCPSIFPRIRVFSDELSLCIRWPNHWSFSFSIGPSNEYSELIFFIRVLFCMFESC